MESYRRQGRGDEGVLLRNDFGGAGAMKKLMTLMVLAAAAFAGGGMLNEHNLTTAVNYLYHKQQVGSVISLGSITSTPPAALPEHLPAAPGAVPLNQGAAPGSQASLPAQAVANAPASMPAAQPAPTGAPPGSQPQTVAQVPGTPPPLISVDWPDKTTSTYKTVPADSTAAKPADKPAFDAAAPPPLSAELASTAAPAPMVPPPAMGTASRAEERPKVDAAVTQAGLNGAASPKAAGAEQTWPELMKKLQSHGVNNISMQGTTSGKLKIKCELASADGLKSQPIEGEGETPQAAAQMALRRVLLFNAARRAAKTAPIAADASLPGTAPQQARIPQFSSPAPPPDYLPPPADAGGPPPAPADVPN